MLIAFVTYGLSAKVFHSKNALAYALLSPAAVGLIIFVLFPFVFNVAIAFSNWRLANLEESILRAGLWRCEYHPRLL